MIYMLRAAGQLDEAITAAESLGDVGLVKTLAVEKRDWQLAAKLQAEDPCRPPCPIPTASPAHAPYAEIEQLGLLASYQRLAGQVDEAQQTLDKIRQLCKENEKNSTYVWHCAQAMLLNDRVSEGLERLAANHQQRLFDLLAYRQEYERALEVVQFDLDQVEAKLSAGGNGSAQLTNFNFLLQVGSVLESMGKEDDATKLYEKLESYASSIGNSSYPSESTLIISLAQHLYRRGKAEQTWRLLDDLSNSRSHISSAAMRLFSSTSDGYRSTASYAWLNILNSKDPQAPASLQLQRVERILSPAQSEDDQWFRPLVDEGLKYLSSMPNKNISYLVGLGITCERRGYLEAAEDAFKMADDAGGYHLGRLYMKQERWEQAADAFARVNASRQQLIAMHLQGECLIKAGKTAAGEELKRTASMLAMSSRTRHQFAQELLKHDFKKEGLAQLRLVLRTAPPEHWEHNDTSRQLALQSVDDFAASAEYWQIYMLGNLRPNFFFNQTVSYLSIPHVIHKLRAVSAAQQGDLDLAVEEAEKCHAATMSATALAELIMPVLNKKDQPEATEAADAIFKPQFDHYVALAQKYPKSALLNNNLAWLCAQADRELDLALTHAEKAVELSPRNAGHLDTLAEVHFRRGDAKKAIEIEEQAYEISPKANFKEQLERFREGLKTPETAQP